VLKHRTIQGSSFRSTAIKAGIFIASAFFLAHFAFGKPKIMADMQPAGQKGDSVLQEKFPFMLPNSTFAQLSIGSREFLETLMRKTHSEGNLPKNTVIAMPELIQTLSEWMPRLANDPNLSATLDRGAQVMENWFNRSEIDIYRLKGLKMRKVAAVLKALQEFPEEQKQLLSELREISKTYTGLVDGQ